MSEYEDKARAAYDEHRERVQPPPPGGAYLPPWDILPDAMKGAFICVYLTGSIQGSQQTQEAMMRAFPPIAPGTIIKP